LELAPYLNRINGTLSCEAKGGEIEEGEREGEGEGEGEGRREEEREEERLKKLISVLEAEKKEEEK